jgi:hypothetical protein
MATTTNFGWETPDDTDLVKDGAAAIRTLGQSIDTSMMDLEGGTTGQVLSKASNTDMDFTWTTVTSGSMTLINTGGTTLAGATTTVSSIPSGYRNLYIVILNYKPATDDARIYVRVNGDAGANRYRTIDTSTGTSAAGYNDTTWTLSLGQDNTTAQGISVFNIYEYANTSIWKMLQGWSLNNNATSAASESYRSTIGFYNQTGAVTSLEFWNSSGNFTSGTVNVYGVK